MDELLEQFLIEGRELVAQAHGDLALLARDPARSEVLSSLFRTVHTLKGSVALFDMGPAEHLLHTAETRLERERGGRTAMGRDDLETLVAVIDQLDRWIDEMEHGGALPADAEARAATLAESLQDDEGEDGERPSETESKTATSETADAPDWLGAMLADSRFRDLDGAATAFRYIPDSECFFRGEDPLALVAGVPDLLAIDVVRSAETPEIADIEPFKCVLGILGVSKGTLKAVQGAFRMVPDQVSFAQIARPSGSALTEALAETLASTSADRATMLRVPADKLDTLAAEVRELAVAMHGLEGVTRQAQRVDRALADELRRIQSGLARAVGTLAAMVADVRLVPLQPVLRRLPRLARELASALDKNVAFELSGDGIEVDKQIAEGLFEPLLHLVRNAIDHGIEAPQIRLRSGKPAQGRVALELARRGDRLVATLVDDGAGIDPATIRKAAVAKGIIAAETAENLGERQVLRLIFAPGFSTSEVVTDVSGRGVGMDAVQRAVERLQGTIDIESEPGQGTRLTIQLPLNAIVTRLLTVSVAGERYGLRMDQIVETLRLDATEIQTLGQGNACIIRDRTVPVVALAALLGHDETVSPVARLVVTDAGGEPMALRVDALGDRLDAPVRERSGLLSALPAVGGTTVHSDGTVLLVLDLPELLA
ncbi:two-component system chemotaxis sensor kinase CheA [Novosphingobium sp. PhB165]|uniref:chemotaxis protein CheA n=1 Tax=Novosphingobium sp. PhB165 TaxID=2485105 RepID=UPI00104351E9|nr:chemotaxis protein CheA [Novosphingobium sp. PhB165]TCM20636.1 two-component system chemotaxis sensor kinase CheA [Novosphingobium sp. PhB165]